MAETVTTAQLIFLQTLREYFAHRVALDYVESLGRYLDGAVVGDFPEARVLRRVLGDGGGSVYYDSDGDGLASTLRAYYEWYKHLLKTETG